MLSTICEFRAANGTLGGGCGAFGGGVDGFGEIDVGDGFEDLERSAGGAAVFEAASSRTWLRIFDVSGVTGDFAVVFVDSAGVVEFDCVGLGVDLGVIASAAFGGVGDGEGVFGAGFGGGAEPEVVSGVAFMVREALGEADLVGAGLGAALVDFDRVVAFFAFSGTSASTRSEMTFLGLPLFLTTSADMLWANWCCAEG